MFARNLGMDLDDYGVVPIRAGGKRTLNHSVNFWASSRFQIIQLSTEMRMGCKKLLKTI